MKSILEANVAIDMAQKKNEKDIDSRSRKTNLVLDDPPEPTNRKIWAKLEEEEDDQEILPRVHITNKLRR